MTTSSSLAAPSRLTGRLSWGGIGSGAKYVSEADALSHIAGYCVVNDISERAYQLEGTGQWVKGKSADTFGPVGPWLVTADEVANPQKLALWLEVDGHRYQSSTTASMIFGVAHLISYLSRFMSLEPGNILSTGTPPGVGLGHPPRVPTSRQSHAPERRRIR